MERRQAWRGFAVRFTTRDNLGPTGYRHVVSLLHATRQCSVSLSSPCCIFISSRFPLSVVASRDPDLPGYQNRHPAVLWKNLVLKDTHSYHNTNSTTLYRHKNRGFITATLVRFPLSASHATPRGVSLNPPKTTTFWFMRGVEWDRVEKSHTNEFSSNDSSITWCDYACYDVSKNMLPPSSWRVGHLVHTEAEVLAWRQIHIEGRGECSQSQLRRGKRGDIVYRTHFASSSHFNIHLNLIQSPWIWWQHVLAKCIWKLIIPHLIVTQTIIIQQQLPWKPETLHCHYEFSTEHFQVLSVLFVRLPFSLHASILQYENGVLHSTVGASYSTAHTINQVTHNVLHTPAPPQFLINHPIASCHVT